MSDNWLTHLNILEKRLYQLIIARLNGDRIESQGYQKNIIELVKKGIGGFILFGGEKDKVRRFIHHIQSISKIPLFIASDIEHGVGQQIINTTMFPCQMAFAAAIDKGTPEDVTILRDALKAIANEAIDCGINMPLTPVLDVNQMPDNPIICTRAFSDKPQVVAWFGSEYIKAIEDAGLLSCAKHFPGHGDTSIDSHISLPIITKTKEDLLSADIMPFMQAIKDGVSSIMVGHLSIPSIDRKPASLSKKVITDLLRKELGFEGLILTDALMMSALKDAGDVPVECVNAGVDILLPPADADDTVSKLVSAIEAGKVKEKQIDTAMSHIAKAKEKLLPRLKEFDSRLPAPGSQGLITPGTKNFLSRFLTCL